MIHLLTLAEVIHELGCGRRLGSSTRSRVGRRGDTLTQCTVSAVSITLEIVGGSGELSEAKAHAEALATGQTVTVQGDARFSLPDKQSITSRATEFHLVRFRSHVTEARFRRTRSWKEEEASKRMCWQL